MSSACVYLSVHPLPLQLRSVCVCVCLPEQKEGKIKSKEHPADKKLFEASEDSTLVASACLYAASQQQTATTDEGLLNYLQHEVGYIFNKKTEVARL